MERTKEIFSKTFMILMTILGIYCAIEYSKEMSQGIKNGLVLCVSTLIPSLFVFMVISSYIANSKVMDILSRVFEKPSQKLLGLSGVCTGVMIMSMLGGYPVGASCISALYKSDRINKMSAQKLALMAVCSGPGFVFNFVGQALFQNKTIGMILFCSQMVSFFTVCIVCSKCIRAPDKDTAIILQTKNSDIVKAVNNGCNATINMCAMVILFSAIIHMCDEIFKSEPALIDAICGMLEVTTACSRLCIKYPIYITSFLIGFGGLCVHFQIFSILRDIGINKFLFFLFRILQGIISAVVTYILLILISPTVEVFSTTDNVVFDNSSTIWGSLALVATAISFLNSIKFSKHIRR